MIPDLFQPPFCPSQVPAQVHHLRPPLLHPALKATVLLIKTGRPADESLPRKTSICWTGSGNIPWMTCPLQVSCLYHQCVLGIINFWWKGVGVGKKSLLGYWSECEKGLSVTLGSVSNQTIFLHSVIDSMDENKVKW